MASDSKQQGFSLVEVVVSMALALIVLAGAVSLFRQGADIGYSVTQRAEMQQNARVAVNIISRDLAVAGTGLPPGGITLPTGVSQPTKRGCDAAGTCGNLGGYPGDMLFYVTPGKDLGPTVNGTDTDALTLAFVDNVITVGQTLNNIDANASGTQLTVDPADVASINDPLSGLKKGDMLFLQNSNGVAIGLVTEDVTGNTDRVKLNPGAMADPININYPAGSASSGNISSLKNPPPDNTYPPTNAIRIHVVSYFIDASDPNEPRLMRQLNAAPAVPVAVNIENLQITYDVINTATSVATADLDSPADAVPAASPNDVRKVNVVVTARSPVRGLFRRGFERMTLATSVSVRNLGWFDRYQ
jgi:type IV pilus assembly protein PilW